MLSCPGGTNNALGVRRGQVPGGSGQPKPEVVTQLQECLVLILGNGQRGDSDGVVYVADAGDVPALAVRRTGAVDAGITDVRLRIDGSPEDPQDGPLSSGMRLRS